MRLLFLRGQVPQDRDPKQIMFDSLKDCDDMWTQLARRLSHSGYGEVWYWGGTRKIRYAHNFVERWLPDFGHKTVGPLLDELCPNIVFARGGFPEYDTVLKASGGQRIYYGAGSKRFFPQTRFLAYSLVLVDSPKKLNKVRKKFPDIKSDLFLKPACDNIFRPCPGNKKFDVIFVANEHPKGIKGHEFALSKIPRNMYVLQVGVASKQLRKKFPNVHFTGWVPRKQLPGLYGQAKVAVVACTERDSCPRVIPEALACNCPILVLDSVSFWSDKYITPLTGRLTTKKQFVDDLRGMVANYEQLQPRQEYMARLSMDVAVNRLWSLTRG